MFTNYRSITIIFAAWNILVMLLYGIDKSRARRGEMRIRETTLIIPPFFLGAMGAMFGMILFNHKTSKIKFRILVPAAMILNVVTVGILDCFL